MTFPRLYAHCQNHAPKIKRNEIRDEVLRLTGRNRIAVVKTELDTTVYRGFYLSARNTKHQFVQQLGCDVIVLARGMNRCWDRMVFVKELMHVFDPPDMWTETPAHLDTVFSELVTSAPEVSRQTLAEWYAIWMALAVLCPEEQRLQLAAERAAGHIDDYAIALQLRIPQVHVPNLFDSRYRPIIDHVLTRLA